MNKLVEVKELYSYYGGICALNGISLYINEGSYTNSYTKTDKLQMQLQS